MFKENSYWTFGINVGTLLEPSLCHHKVRVLDVGSEFLSLVHVQLLKDVVVNSRRSFFVSSGIFSNWSCMCGLFMRWQVVVSIFLKISSMHTKPLTDLFKNKKKSKTFTMFFHILPIRTRLHFILISSCCCNCLLAIAILLIFLEPDIVAHILRIQQTYSLTSIKTIYSDILSMKYELLFHLTRAKSQATMMVSVPQGFDIGLFENPTMLMLWLTQLVGRPIDILP
jgi:hypothetical protein